MVDANRAFRPSAHFSNRMRHWRTERGMSLQQLVIRLEELGWPISRTALGEIEAGKRHVKLDEFLAISAALNVAPPAMLLPTVDGPDVTAVTPEVTLPAFALIRWLAGDMPLIDSSGSPIDHERWARSVTPLSLMRRQHELANTVTRLRREIDRMSALEHDDDSIAAQQRHERHERLDAETREFARHLKFMLDAGMPPLPISREMFVALNAIGAIGGPNDYEQIDSSRLTITNGDGAPAEQKATDDEV